MGAETAALLGINAVGAGLGIWGQSQQNKQQRRLANQAMGYVQNTPGTAEAALANFLPYLNGNGSFNTGQDALMQYLRADPSSQRTYVDSALQGIVGQSDPFAAGGAYSAVDAVNQREAARQVAALQGSAGSLGRRFGSNIAAQETQLRSTLAQNAAAQRYDAAQQFQNMRLGAASLANTREAQLRDSRFNAAASLQQGGQAQMAMLLQALQASGGLEAQRRAGNLSLLGFGAGNQGSNLGQGVGDAITNLSMLYYLMQPGKTSAAGGYSGSNPSYVGNATIY